CRGIYSGLSATFRARRISMKRLLLSLPLLIAAALPVRAHFVWLLPSPADAAKPGVWIVFSDKLPPEDPPFFDKIKQSQHFVLDKDGKPAALKMTQGKEAWEAEIPGKGMVAVAAACDYGVTQRGDVSFLLRYYAKTVVMAGPVEGDLRPLMKAALTAPCDKLALDIRPGDANTIRVLWQGKPLAEAEGGIIGDGDGKPLEFKTDK